MCSAEKHYHNRHNCKLAVDCRKPAYKGEYNKQYRCAVWYSDGENPDGKCRGEAGGIYGQRVGGFDWHKAQLDDQFSLERGEMNDNKNNFVCR